MVKEKTNKFLSMKIVVPVFVLVVLILGAGLAYAYNPDLFQTNIDSFSSKFDTGFISGLTSKASQYFGVEADEKDYWGGDKNAYQKVAFISDQEQTIYLPDINVAAVKIYGPGTNKTRNDSGLPPVYVGKAIEIDLSSQRMIIWENGRLLYNWATSTGRPDKPTRRGNFKIISKHEMAYGSGEGDTWAMPYWMGFYYSGGTENGIHGLPFINGRKEGHGSLGWPVSHGCVRVADSNIVWLYNWAEIGTPVIVHK